jgi:hypothetical protein
MSSKCDSKIREVLILPAQTPNDDLDGRPAYRILTLYERKYLNPSSGSRFGSSSQLGGRCLYDATRARAFRAPQGSIRAVRPALGPFPARG